MKQAIDLLFIKYDQILLVKKENLWILPGGKIKKGKDDFESLERKIGEELNTKVFIGNFYKTFFRANLFGRNFLEVKTYFSSLIKNMTSSEEIGNIKFVSNPHECPVSYITKEIISSLEMDGYLYGN